MRTDIHRPSVIQPEDYEFVGLETQKVEGMSDVYAVIAERERINAHMERTGGKRSGHEHGGNCHVCGAHCVYTALFYHQKTNTYIRTGMDCAEKLWQCDAIRFRVFRDAIRAAQEHLAGKRKAEGVLIQAGLERAWQIANLPSPGSNPWAYNTLCDIVRKLIRYGSISERQIGFLKSLVEKIDKSDEVQAKREMEREAAEDAPEGRVEFTGEVLSIKEQESQYGTTWKMLVKSVDKGFKVFCTIPSSMDVVRGSRVQLCVTITRSDKDPKFGFGKRPTGKVLESPVEAMAS